MRVSWRAGLVAIVIATATAGVTAASASGSPTAKPSKSTIALGWVGDTSSAQGSAGQATRAAVLAWAKWVNAHGGIVGHPVNVIAKDVGTDPAKTESTVKDLVENQHVVAFVGNAASSTDSVFKQYLIDQNIPIVGGQAYSTAMAGDQLFFPASAWVFTSVWMQPYAASKANADKMGLFWCSSNPACAGAVPLYSKDAKENNVTLVFDQKIDDSASDYTANCLAAKDASANSLAVAAGASQGTRVIQSCARQAYNPTYVVPASAYSDVLLKLAKAGTLKNLSVPSDSFLWFTNAGNKSSTAFKNYLAAMKQYAKGTTSGPSTTLGWVAGELFAAAGKGFGDTVTSADVLTGLYALNGETLDGLAPQPLTYTKGKPTTVNCFFLAALKGTKLQAVDGGKPACQPAT